MLCSLALPGIEPSTSVLQVRCANRYTIKVKLLIVVSGGWSGAAMILMSQGDAS
jgi:hypothetical protein